MKTIQMMTVTAITITVSAIGYVAILHRAQPTNEDAPASTSEPRRKGDLYHQQNVVLDRTLKEPSPGNSSPPTSGEKNVAVRPQVAQHPTFLTFQIPSDWSKNEQLLMKTLQTWDCRDKPKSQARSSKRVVQILEDFVEASDSDAALVLGILSMNGWVITADQKRGLDLLRKASDLGNKRAVPICAEYIYGFSEDTNEHKAALETLRKCAEAGDSHCQAALARIYYLGLRMEQNAPEAIRWFISAIKANPEYEAMIPALLSATVLATPTEQVKGDIQTLLVSRADGGSTHAVMGLGQAYETGALGTKDESLAIHWYEKAMKLEVPESFGAMGSLIMNRVMDRANQKTITDEEYAEAKALYVALFAKGAELGDERSKVMMRLTAPMRFGPAMDYSMESMLNRASEDALLDAAGLERVR